MATTPDPKNKQATTPEVDEMSKGMVSPAPQQDAVSQGVNAMDAHLNPYNSDGTPKPAEQLKSERIASANARAQMEASGVPYNNGPEGFVMKQNTPTETVAPAGVTAPKGGFFQNLVKDNIQEGTHGGGWARTGKSLGLGVADDLIPRADNNTALGWGINKLRDAGVGAANAELYGADKIKNPWLRAVADLVGAGMGIMGGSNKDAKAAQNPAPQQPEGPYQWQTPQAKPNFFSQAPAVYNDITHAYDQAKNALQTGFNYDVQHYTPYPLVEKAVQGVANYFTPPNSGQTSAPVTQQKDARLQVDDMFRPTLPTFGNATAPSQQPTESPMTQSAPAQQTAESPMTQSAPTAQNQAPAPQEEFAKPKMYAPGVTQQALDMIKWRTAYGMNDHSLNRDGSGVQSNQALENQYQYGMQGINEMQSAFRQREINDAARRAGIVQPGYVDGQERTMPVDSFGKVIMPKAGDMIDENGHVTRSDMGDGVLGKDPQGRAAMVYATPYGYVYTPVNQQDSPENVAMRGNIQNFNNQLTAREQAESVLNKQGMDKYGIPLHDQFMQSASEQADQMRNSPEALDEQRRQNEIAAKSEMDEAVKPQLNGEPLHDVPIGRQVAEAARRMAFAHGQDENDPTVASRYLPNDNTGSQAHEMRRLGLEALRGNSIEDQLVSSAYRNNGGTKIDEASNKEALSHAAVTGGISGKERNLGLKAEHYAALAELNKEKIGFLSQKIQDAEAKAGETSANREVKKNLEAAKLFNQQLNAIRNRKYPPFNENNPGPQYLKLQKQFNQAMANAGFSQEDEEQVQQQNNTTETTNPTKVINGVTYVQKDGKWYKQS